MAKKIVNERCPFKDECEKKCTYKMHEKDCGYYAANATDTNHIDDQWTDNFFPDELFEQSKGELVYLPIGELFPHPDNPRKDLGDLEELAESIKAKGIMQNLTVIKGHWWTMEEYLEAAKAEGVAKGTAKLSYDPNGSFLPNGYTVIIGHRRLGAAKLAGIDELPCVITEMSPQDQVATMLLENMQRSDLTVYEQAQGFQMMLDFGESIETIAEKSGFSKTTVRRRVKLLDLDAEKFKKAEKRGATLFDYAELDKINDPELKNEVLDTIGTDNFKWSLKRAIEKEENEVYLATVREKLSSFATETEDTSGMQYVKSYGSYSKTTDYEKPEDADDVKYFFIDRGNYIYLYREYTDEENAAKAADEERADKIKSARDELEKLTTIAFECRKEFVDEITQTDIKKNLAEILSFWMFSQSLDTTRLDEADILIELGLLTEENEDEELTYTYDDVLNIVMTKPELYLWRMICLYVNDNDDRGYYTYQMEHRNNQKLSDWYDFLVKLGYEMSDDENALRDGTHELFKKDESEES